MNATQHAAAIEVILCTEFLCGSWLARDSRRAARGFLCCAVGELALAAGHSRAELDVAGTERFASGLPLLTAVFGLDDADCNAIATANDEPRDQYPVDHDGVIVTTSERRHAVLATLDEIAAQYARAAAPVPARCPATVPYSVTRYDRPGVLFAIPDDR